MGEERKGRGGGEEEAAVAAARAAEQARELQDAAAALLTRTRAEEEALRRRAAALQAELRRLRKAAADSHADSDKVRLPDSLFSRCVCVLRVPAYRASSPFCPSARGGGAMSAGGGDRRGAHRVSRAAGLSVPRAAVSGGPPWCWIAVEICSCGAVIWPAVIVPALVVPMCCAVWMPWEGTFPSPLFPESHFIMPACLSLIDRRNVHSLLALMCVRSCVRLRRTWIERRASSPTVTSRRCSRARHMVI
jgi:hypothetical protein